MDNYATYKTPEVKAWFGIIDRQAIGYSIFTSAEGI